MTTMRYITVPKPVELPGMKKPGTEEAVTMSFFEYHEQNVWNSPEWRSSAEMHKVFRELTALFDEAQELKDSVGAVLEVPGRHYEIYLPIATGKGQQLAPRVARALSPHHAAIFDAPTKDPRESNEEPKKETEKAAKKAAKKATEEKQEAPAETAGTN
jgi:hypothetical protein